MNSPCQWVESPLLSSEEDEMFEANSSKPNSVLNLVVNNATDPSEDHSDRDLYYGDEPDFDSEDRAANPLNLIQCYAERSFPRAQLLDFSGCVDLPSAAVDEQFRRRGAIRLSKAPGEPRGELILRLRRQLQELERQEEAVSTALSDRSQTTTLPLESLRNSLTTLSNDIGEQGGSGVAVDPDAGPLSSRSVPCDLSLERRVAKLESYLAACDFSEGEGLWGLVESVRLRWQSADPSFWSEVRSAIDSASSRFESTRSLGMGVDFCELLRRLNAIEVDACSIPTLVARLRTLKQSLDDSSAGTARRDALAQRCETLLCMKTENDTLLAQLKANLEETAATTARNMESLEFRLNRALSL